MVMGQNNRGSVLPWALLTIPVLWLSALLASGYADGMTLIDLMAVITAQMAHTVAIRWNTNT